MSRRRRRNDPFAPTANLTLYVPRDATERAVFELMRSVRDEERCTALIGPPGLGKTFLLRLLAARLDQEFDSVYVANAAMPAPELCAWVLGRRKLPRSDVPVASLLAHARERQSAGRGILLLLDDAGSIPVATLIALRRLSRASPGALRMVVAVNDEPAVPEAVVDALGHDTDVIRIARAMTESETRRYVEGRLQLARAPKRIRSLFDPATVAGLHRASRGVPGALHARANEVLRAAEIAAAETAAARAGATGRSEPPAARPRDPALPPTEASPRRLRLAAPPKASRVFQTGLVLAAAVVAIVLIRTALLARPATYPRAASPGAAAPGALDSTPRSR